MLATIRSVSLGRLDSERFSTALQRSLELEDFRSNESNQAIEKVIGCFEERTSSGRGCARHGEPSAVADESLSLFGQSRLQHTT
jgi:hypothetical protein